MSAPSNSMVANKKSSSLGNKQLDEAEKNFQEYEKGLEIISQEAMNAAPKEEVEQQTRLSSREIAKSKDIYLKPKRTINSKEPFNEKYREDYEFAKQYVYFIAENKEIIGETITAWTKKFAGVPAEEWEIPVNKPVWGPRYLAEQIKACSYTEFVMKGNQEIGSDSMGSYYSNMAVGVKKQRLDAIPATKQKSIFMGSDSF